jgi:hypothetical protein
MTLTSSQLKTPIIYPDTDGAPMTESDPAIAPKKKGHKSICPIADESKQLGKSTENSDEIK